MFVVIFLSNMAPNCLGIDAVGSGAGRAGVFAFCGMAPSSDMSAWDVPPHSFQPNPTPQWDTSEPRVLARPRKRSPHICECREDARAALSCHRVVRGL